jgi:hypothetical protein
LVAGAAHSCYLAASGMDLMLIAKKKEDLDQYHLI